MKKQFFAMLIAAMIALPATAQNFSPLYQDGKIWFKIRDDYRTLAAISENPADLPFASVPALESLVKGHALTRLSRPFAAAQNSPVLQRTYLLEFSDHANVEQIIRKLELLGGIEYAEKVPLDKTCLVPNDPSYGSQWGLNVIGAPVAWNYFSAGSTIVIAIVDDAVERTHPDLSPNLWVNPGEIPANGIDDDNNGYTDDINGYDVGSNDNNPNPPSNSYDHGTHVAGISSARSNNNTGVASIGFSCKLMCLKATNTPTAITNGYEGVVYAAANGADIINMSWGGPSSSTTAQNIINYAWSQGCILIAAAGNDNVSSQFYPAAYTNVISVAATNSNDTKASFSNYGSWVDISAPGNNIFSTGVGGNYVNKSGTSMASPMVAGLAGLMWSLNPAMTRADLISCLLTTSTSIAAMNPSYPGQLGAGRINAANAMQCVSVTLNNAPVADFAANYTSITAGGSVIYTDYSTYNPTSWSWSFPGGTPASFNGQVPPPITYNAAGTYNAVLTVTNANGTDTETKTSYITVNAAGGCFSVNLPLPVTWTPTNYYTGATPGGDGWINGVNVYLDREKAMYFDMSAQPYTFMTQAFIAFGVAYSANPAKIVPVKVYDGTTGTPGAQIGTTNLTMGQIMSDVNGGFYTVADFVTPITLPASKRFFVSVDLNNLQWSAGVKDTLNVVSNTNGQTTPSTIWERQSDNLWYQYGAPGSWNLSASLLVHPFLTNQPTVATFTQTSTNICSGEGISFDAAGSTYGDTLLWVFPGGTPNVVSQNPQPSVIFNNPGSYTVQMYVIGGGCSELDSAQVTINVSPTPSVMVTAPQYDICPGGSVVLTASGAASYTWSPAGSLSAPTGAVVTASPTQTTTYNVQGTTGACSGNTTIEIEVQQNPSAQLSASDTTINCGASVVFDGSGSTDAAAFLWDFTNGSPLTSSATGENVTYTVPGTHNVMLVTSNNCGADTAVFSVIVLNNCSTTGIGQNGQNILNAIYDPLQDAIHLQFSLEQPMSANVYLTNQLGQTVYSGQWNVAPGSQVISVGTSALAAGIYVLQVTDGQQNHSFKMMMH